DPRYTARPALRPFPTRRSSDLRYLTPRGLAIDAEFMHTMMGTPAAQSLPRFREHYRLADAVECIALECKNLFFAVLGEKPGPLRSEEHTSELQSLRHLVCRLLL